MERIFEEKFTPIFVTDITEELTVCDSRTWEDLAYTWIFATFVGGILAICMIFASYTDILFVY